MAIINNLTIHKLQRWGDYGYNVKGLGRANRVAIRLAERMRRRFLLSAVATKEKMSVRHMLVVLTGIMITFGCSALCFSTWGLFQPVVSSALEIPTTSFALYITIMYLAMTVASPFAGKLLQTVDARIVLTVCAVLVGASFILMSMATSIVFFYIAGVLLGIGEVVLLWLAVPTLINNWFAERAGFFIGICMCMTGVGGAVWSSVFTALTTSGMAFHQIYMIWGVIALVTSVPFTLFCVRTRPEDCGLRPYGASVSSLTGAPSKPRGLSASAAMKSPVFYVLCLFAGLINIAILVAQQFPTYTKSLTDVAFDVVVVGGIMATVMMVGQAIAKVALGGFADKNARTTLIFAFSCGVIGVLLCWFGTASEFILYGGAFIFGFMYATAVTLVPIMARQIFGTREYSLIYSRISSVFNLVASFASLIWAWIGGSFGFNAVFAVALVMFVAILVMGLYCFAKQKSIVAAWTE